MVEASAEVPLLVVTGATGFLGSQVCLAALKAKDRFRVRATVRDLKDSEKISDLKSGLGEENFERLELVEADLLDPDSFIKAFANASFVIHTASPMPLQAPKNFEDLRKPSVEGSLSVLRACQASSVKRLVMTSHYGAINHVDELDRPDIYTEEVWSDLERENQDPVHKSKFMAEKALWEAQKESPSSLELVTVCPTLLVGPSLMGTRPNITSDFIKKMMSGELQGMYRVMFGLVDVRDAATAHLAAVSSEQAANQRILLCSGESLWCRDIGNILVDEFKDKGFTFNLEEVKHCKMRFWSFLSSASDSEMKAYETIWGKHQDFDNSKSLRVLGDFKYEFNAEQSLIATGNHLIQSGQLKR